jgi:hypothetical protein
VSEPDRGWSSDPNVSLLHRVVMYALTRPKGEDLDPSTVAEALDQTSRR